MNFKVIIFSSLVLLILACGQQKKDEVSQSKTQKNKIDSIKKVDKPSKGDIEKKETTELTSSKKPSKPNIVFIPPEVMPYPEPIPDPGPVWRGDPEWGNDNVGTIEVESGNDEPPAEEALSFAEVMPEFPGGYSKMAQFIMENLIYPIDAKEMDIQGKVYVQFVVNEDGRVSDCKLLRGLYPSIDREALRVAGKMPNWTPGENQGKKVKVKMVIPVKFLLK